MGSRPGIAPVFLRLALGLTFLWAGLGKIADKMDVTPQESAALQSRGDHHRRERFGDARDAERAVGRDRHGFDTVGAALQGAGGVLADEPERGHLDTQDARLVTDRVLGLDHPLEGSGEGWWCGGVAHVELRS